VAEARKAIAGLGASARPDAAAYLALRRAVTAGGPLWRRAAPTGAEVLLGPATSTLEAGGAMSLLDSALEGGDGASAAEHRGAVDRALTHIDYELSRLGLTEAETVQVLSDAAYDFGLSLLEATAAAPAGRSTIVADWHGWLDGLKSGIDALAEKRPDQVQRQNLARSHAVMGELRAAIRAVGNADELSGRAALVRQTGELGVAIRGLFADGKPARLPYAPRVLGHGGGIAESVHALTLPAPRRGIELAESLVEAGALLFADPRLSKDNARSCATCHQPARYFTDGLVRPKSLTASKLRNTPSLLYAPLLASQLWDGRVVSAARQALRVIHSEAEMGLLRGELVTKLRDDETYTRLLEPFGGITEKSVAQALEAFQIARLVPGDAPVDRYARGDDDALDAQSQHGLDVFAGRARCTRCHIPPSFAGVRPRGFDTSVYAVLGVPASSSGVHLDADRGRGAVTGRGADEHAFKAPTVRNVAKTAPYFHHGAFASLSDVVDFYDRGGPGALPYDVPHLDPDIVKLELTPSQKTALLHFMEVGLLDATAPKKAAFGESAGDSGRSKSGEFEARGNR